MRSERIVKSIQDSIEQLPDYDRWLKQVDALRKENIALKKKVFDLKNTLQETNDQCKAYRKDLEWEMQSIDDLEQYTRKFNLKIYGIAEIREENRCEQVVKLSSHFSLLLFTVTLFLIAT